MTTMLLAQDFPPMGGGIARLHEELARRFPPGELIVSTPADRDASEVDGAFPAVIDRLDRKSTRLNSSHRCISYAVFCLKKKKNIHHVHFGCDNISAGMQHVCSCDV